MTPSEDLTLVWPRTSAALAGLLELDLRFVGTPNYMGLAYFWNYDYKYAPRRVTCRPRQRVHDALLQAGLDLSEEAPAASLIPELASPRASANPHDRRLKHAIRFAARTRGGDQRAVG